MAPALLIVLLFAQAPAAQRLHVEWSAPDECPARAELTSGLESSVPKDRTFSASVRIEAPPAPGQSWRAVVVTTSEDGQHSRVVEAPDCGKVGQAAVLVVTLAATRVQETAVPPAGPVALPAAPSAAPPVATLPAAAEQAPPPRRPPWSGPSIRLQLLTGGSVGVLPTADPFLGVAVAAGLGPVRLELAYTRWLDSQTARQQRGARFTLESLHLSGAWLFRPASRLELGPCLAAEAGLLEGQGLGVTTPATQQTPWVAVLAGATLGYEVSRALRAWVSLEGGLNVVHPAFVIDTPTGPAMVHQMGWPAARLALGVELHTP